MERFSEWLAGFWAAAGRLLSLEVTPLAAAIVCIAVWNVVSLAVTLLDKRAAQRGEWRVPERRFVFFAATLGGPGVLLGFYAARHKIRKGYLLVSVWALTLIETAVLGYLFVKLI